VPAGKRETSSRVSRPQLLFRQDTSSLRTPSALIFASVEGVPSQCCAVMFIVRGKPNADDAPMRFKRPALKLDIPVGEPELVPANTAWQETDHGEGWNRAYCTEVGCTGPCAWMMRSWSLAILVYWSWAVAR
jgi:hypothetical protein